MPGSPPRPPSFLPDGTPRFARLFMLSELLAERGHRPNPRRGVPQLPAGLPSRPQPPRGPSQGR